MDFAKRRRAVVAGAKAAGVEGVVVTHLPDVRWLTGFTGSNAAVVLAAGKSVLFTDGRYTAQARAEAKGVRVVVEKKAAVGAACAWLGGAGVGLCGFDDGNTSVAELKGMKADVAKAKGGWVRFVPVGSLVAGLREVKDSGEIEVVREAARLGCKLFDEMLGVISSGMTEVQVAAELEYRARRAGAEAMSFETIVASGVRSALPHGRATGAKVPKKGFVTLDFGVVVGGYCSDMTRTVHMGRGEAEEVDVYHSVLEAQIAGVQAIAPGVSCGEVDEACRSVLRRAKLEKWFSHSTGHGVGLEIHEGPRLAAKQTQKLQAGMVVTIEPGVYLPGRFGVRIEDMVLVTKGGGEILTPSTKAWIEL